MDFKGMNLPEEKVGGSYPRWNFTDHDASCWSCSKTYKYADSKVPKLCPGCAQQPDVVAHFAESAAPLRATGDV